MTWNIWSGDRCDRLGERRWGTQEWEDRVERWRCVHRCLGPRVHSQPASTVSFPKRHRTVAITAVGAVLTLLLGGV